MCRLDTRIGQAFAARGASGRRAFEAVELIASHGQTLFHWVQDGAGRGHAAARAAGVDRGADRRCRSSPTCARRDVAAGGQGAPLVSLLDTLLLNGRDGTPAALNLGGIANLTVPPIAFDTGPANALLDAAARHFTGRHYDEDGGSRRAAPSTTRCSTDCSQTR